MSTVVNIEPRILAIYREFTEQNDGFIITAFFTTRIKKLLERRIVWQRHP